MKLSPRLLYALKYFSLNLQQHQKQGNHNKPADEEWQTQKRKVYRLVQHNMDIPKSPKETLLQQQTHHTCRQDLITPTSETKKKDHRPGPTGDNSQQNGKDNDQTPSNNKSKGEARLDPTHLVYLENSIQDYFAAIE
ncbi:hypothetical protein RDI58_013430 [Solanum bulbocastanum]|uniref:Uncharacterized protein n=1 Tax=Solanum bulbocastanum TaxID=147425 RepID=A0AAN8TM59_SOLBU